MARWRDGEGRLVAIAGHLAIEHPHHRLEEQALALVAGMPAAIASLSTCGGRPLLIARIWLRQTRSIRYRRRYACATVSPVTRTPWFFMKTIGLGPMSVASRSPSSSDAATPV